MEPILMSFATEMDRNPKLSPVSSLVPAGYKSNTKKPHNGNKKKTLKMLINENESTK